ncbi:SMI1/KNR4 family protein [Parachitinimonas caeni]|uniref:SMI1/KNR4 family protein n=1 Tax=Parachitinimonas caeni TaxID=3031301 RepID=A0ABT7E3Y7_9NEIS|nr:SMI1/KNR4 family protein [Parachitinimonas caeni]MDK2127018.1 SMI1/KNR4 family protein [Parachitinimonas caeni]
MNKDTLISSLIDAQLCKQGEAKGCSQEEIAALEQSTGLSFPLQYREFLLAIGKRAGRLFQGTDIFLPAISGLKDEAINLLEENEEDFNLPKEAFVFSMHQGYEFNYFNTSEGDDPPVYQYVEGNGPPVLTWNSFSEFLNDSITLHSRSMEN